MADAHDTLTSKQRKSFQTRNQVDEGGRSDACPTSGRAQLFGDNSQTSKTRHADAAAAPGASRGGEWVHSANPSAVSVKEQLSRRRESRSPAKAGAAPTTPSLSALVAERRRRRIGLGSPADGAGAAPESSIDELKEAVRRCTAAHGVCSTLTGRAWHRLANAVAAEGDVSRCLFCLSEATKILQRSSSPEGHLEAATTAMKFAALSVRTRRYAAAAPAYRLALQLQRGILGDSHPTLAPTALELAELLHFQLDRSAEAIALTSVVLKVLQDNECDDVSLIASVERRAAEMAAGPAQNHRRHPPQDEGVGNTMAPPTPQITADRVDQNGLVDAPPPILPDEAPPPPTSPLPADDDTAAEADHAQPPPPPSSELPDDDDDDDSVQSL